MKFNLYRNDIKALAIVLLLIMLLSACESALFYQEPVHYPAVFTFTGTVQSEDSLLLNGIKVVLLTPSSPDSTIIYSDSNGIYRFKQEIEFVGPNTLIVKDIDGHDNGGYYQGTDTKFYMREEDWEDMTVQYDFLLKNQ